MGTMPDGRHASGSLSLTGTIFKPFGCYLAAGNEIKTPPLSCVTTPLNRYNMRDGWIAFDDQ